MENERAGGAMAIRGGGSSGSAGAGEPLIGRGSAGRRDGNEPPILSDPDPGTSRARSIPRPPAAPPRRRWAIPDSVAELAGGSRVRLALGVALVVVLAAGWLAVGGRGTGPSSDPRTPAAAPATTSAPRPPPTFRAAPIARPVAVPGWVPRAIAATCHARATTTAVVVVHCTPGRGVISLRYRHFPSVAALRAAYLTEPTARGGSGPPKCASGATDERSWSRPTTPALAVGRYRCALVAGHARITWTSERERVLASAERADADLRSLYEWWTTVPGPAAPAKSAG